MMSFTGKVLACVESSNRWWRTPEIIRRCGAGQNNPRARVWRSLTRLEKAGHVVRVERHSSGTIWQRT